MTQRIGNYVFLALFAALLAVAAAVLAPAQRQYRNAKKDLTDLKTRLESQEQTILEIRREISRLRSDYRAIERVAREKFGYCRDGEKIYHFESLRPDP